MCRATSKSRSLTGRFKSGDIVPHAKETIPSCGVRYFLHASRSPCLADSDWSFKEKNTLCANMDLVVPISGGHRDSVAQWPKLRQLPFEKGLRTSRWGSSSWLCKRYHHPRASNRKGSCGRRSL